MNSEVICSAAVVLPMIVANSVWQRLFRAKQFESGPARNFSPMSLTNTDVSEQKPFVLFFADRLRAEKFSLSVTPHCTMPTGRVFTSSHSVG